MNRKLCGLISLILIGVLLPSGCNREGISRIMVTPLEGENPISVPAWGEPGMTGLIRPYTLKDDLSDIANIDELTDLNVFDKYMLYRNQFIIKKADTIFEQPFDIYEKNVGEGIPNFITPDSMLHVYHLMCDYLIKTIERERLVNELRTFTKEAFKKSLLIYNGTKEEKARKAALKNVAYFGIAMRLFDLNLPGGIPMEANRIIDNDVKRIRSRWSSGSSEIFPYYIEYRNYIATGHYSREADLRRYFLVMKWYSNTPLLFDSYQSKEGSTKKMDEQMTMAVIMAAQILGDEILRGLWEDIYRVSAMYWGKADDLNLYDLSDIIKEVFGKKIDFNKTGDKVKLQRVYELAKRRYDERLNETMAGKIRLSDEDMNRQVQFRLMGRMYNLDSDIYSNVTAAKDPESGQSRVLPKGLDILSVLGSGRADTILTDQMNEDTLWANYSYNMERMREVLAQKSWEGPEGYSLNNSMLWVVRGYIGPCSQGYPPFMTNDRWVDKKLLTASGALCDFRCLSSLTAKEDEAANEDLGGVVEISMPGYVEPDINVYSRLGYMSKYVKAFLSANNFTNAGIYTSLDEFIDLAGFLEKVSLKELENKPLTEYEKFRLRNFDRELKALTMNAVEAGDNKKNWEMVPDVDRNMASVADAYSNGNNTLQTAVGTPDYIYVVVPYNNELYITRGSVYSYYELTQTSKKLTESTWEKMLEDGREIEQQMWVKMLRY